MGLIGCIVSKIGQLMLDDIAIFIDVVKYGSLTAAAKRLGMPKSKISRRIQYLEAELNTILLRRTTRHQALTKEGEQFFRLVSSSIKEVNENVSYFKQQKHEQQGEVFIQIPNEFFNRVIAKLLVAFKQAYPNIRVTCHHSNDHKIQLDVKYDLIFALHEHSLPESDWVGRNLISFPQSIYCCLHSANQIKVKSIQSLANVGSIGDESTAIWYFRNKDKVEAVEVESSFVLTSPEMQMASLSNSQFVAKLPDFHVNIAGYDDKLAKLALPAQPLAKQLTVLYQNRHLPMRTRLFLDFFQSHLSEFSQ